MLCIFCMFVLHNYILDISSKWKYMFTSFQSFAKGMEKADVVVSQHLQTTFFSKNQI